MKKLCMRITLFIPMVNSYSLLLYCVTQLVERVPIVVVTDVCLKLATKHDYVKCC